MNNRALTGTTPCTKSAVVLDVPPEAQFIALGVMLEGRGCVELSRVDIEAVDGTVAVTDQLVAKQAQRVGEGGLGRVGSVRFTEERVSSEVAGAAMTREGARWIGEELEAAFINGRIVARRGPHSGTFQVRRSGESTIIEGTWGTAVASYPVVIRYNRATLDMKWGFYERHLKQELVSLSPEACVYYSQRSGGVLADGLELCGSVLDENPLPVQTVIAFMWNGFHRAKGGDLGTLPTNPDQPGAPSTHE